jgi:hypothetical protein
MSRWFTQALRAPLLAGAFLGIESLSATLPAQTCNDGAILISTFGVTGLAVFDIVTAPASARRYNQGPVAIAPYFNPRERSYGVSVTWFYRRPVPLPMVRRPVRVLPAVTGDTVRAHKSPGAAFALSFFSTAIPVAAGAGFGGGGGAGVFLAGIVVGPSVGHFYAGQPVRGVVTAAVRGAGTLLFVSSIAECLFD